MLLEPMSTRLRNPHLHIKNILKEYDLEKIIDARVLNVGLAATNIIIRTKKNKYIMKIFGSANYKKYFLEVSARNFACEKGIPTSCAYKNSKGELITKYNGCYVTIFEFIEGKKMRYGKNMDKYMFSIGKILGNMDTIYAKFFF